MQNFRTCAKGVLGRHGSGDGSSCRKGSEGGVRDRTAESMAAENLQLATARERTAIEFHQAQARELVTELRTRWNAEQQQTRRLETDLRVRWNEEEQQLRSELAAASDAAAANHQQTQEQVNTWAAQFVVASDARLINAEDVWEGEVREAQVEAQSWHEEYEQECKEAKVA